MASDDNNLESEVFTYGVAEIIDQDSLRRRLSAGKPLKVKFGVDPTTPDLHLGHAIALRKLRQFQELGHHTVLLIGDFTTMIGDPSGRSATRPVLSEDEIKANMETYISQAKLIIDPEKTEVRFNSEWLSKKSYADFIKIATQVSLQTLLEREDFSERIKNNQPLALHELFYPVTQGIDSVEMEADVEIGGWDQRLNLLMGRELQNKFGQTPQEIVVTKPLLGVDGERKMSKSYGNYVGLTEPPHEMFGKVMSIPDKLTDSYAELAALMNESERSGLPEHPRDKKVAVAKKIVELYHGVEVANLAAQNFDRAFSKGEVVSELANEVLISGVTSITILEAVKHASGVSASEAARLIDQGGVKLDGQVVADANLTVDVSGATHRLQIGKHRFYELVKEA
ncbi:MAG: tyrosine--tRNA ligase [Candidatus Berkelbacteria bacterium]|nr:MAG: tyrosine--tRNA ligase [Candidatus Berkelbacteria bacterium]QQG51481.1 MAG: tyrosine--tRNA ligase [Candidatus Berkelbacteria bacterium]